MKFEQGEDRDELKSDDNDVQMIKYGNNLVSEIG
jgi:hypothetical protein